LYALPPLKLHHLLRSQFLLLALSCLLTGALLGPARTAAAQAAELWVTITRPSEGETFYAGETSLLYSTPINVLVSSDKFKPEEMQVNLAIYQNGRLEN